MSNFFSWKKINYFAEVAALEMNAAAPSERRAFLLDAARAAVQDARREKVQLLQEEEIAEESLRNARERWLATQAIFGELKKLQDEGIFDLLETMEVFSTDDKITRDESLQAPRKKVFESRL